MEIAMNWNLSNRLALVTGGSKGLGLATARKFVAANARVVIVARGEAELEAARDELARGAQATVAAYVCDVTSSEQIADVHARIERDLGGIDILFNNAGTHAHDDFLRLSDADWAADLELKLMSNVRFARLAMPGMIERRWGRIINIVNTMAKAPKALTAPTSVSRAAQMALTKVLAGEGGPHNVLVNAIAVGLIHSDQLARAHASSGTNKSYGDFTNGLAQKLGIPLGRVGESEELANVVCFLASDASSYVTGTVLNVDGGMCPTY